MRIVNALVLVTALIAGSGSFLDEISSLFSALRASTSAVDEGCQLDPDGRCKPVPTQDNGCELDPYGRPVCSPARS